MKELKETVELMTSKDYKERFKAEYLQIKIRFDKPKNFNNKIEAWKRLDYVHQSYGLDKPKYDCPNDLLREQQRVMGEYLHIL